MHKAQEHEGVLVNIPQPQEIIIAAILRLIRASKESIQKKMEDNFFINHGKATANDIWELIQLARQKVKEKFGVSLDLEIELLGAWNWEQIK
jgi:UDP-N-acetylmuramate dehydrogenase